MSRDESRKVQVNRNSLKDALPKEIAIPDDFEGVLQINIQSQKETETESVTQNQAQAANTAVSVSQMQSQMQSIGSQLQGLQAQLQGLQSQMQLLFMAVLGAPAGADAGERQRLLREIVAAVRGEQA